MRFFFVFLNFFLTVWFTNVFSQTIRPPDPYSAVIQLNPAYTAYRNCTQFNLNSYQTHFDTYFSVSAEHDLRKFNSSVGFILSNRIEGDGVLQTQAIQILYTYLLYEKEHQSVRLGFSPTLTIQSVHPESIILPSNLPVNGARAKDGTLFKPKISPNFKLSALFLSKNYQAGIIFDGFQQFPNIVKKIPSVSIHFGKIISLLSKKTLIMPNIIVVSDNGNSYFWAGLRLNKNFFFINFSINFQHNINTLSPIFTVGINYSKYRLSYTYKTTPYPDFGLIQTVHGINLGYELACKKQRKNMQTIYCIDF